MGPGDALEQSKRLLAQRETGRADFEASLQDSRRALARSQKMLDKLQETIARAMNQTNPR
jgi:hypothetical protein